MTAGLTLVIACGALAHEIVALRKANAWWHLEVTCLPADLHNHPERIPAAVREAIRANRHHHAAIFVAYADCGTGGLLDAVLAEEGVERLPGAHCYEFFAGPARFAGLADAEPGTFYLTDFLVRHFDRLVIQGLGLDRHPRLLPMYFGRYTRLMYLAQQPTAERLAAARAAADRLGLRFESIDTGYGELGGGLARLEAPRAPVVREQVVAWPS